MSAIAAIVLADALATPVNHTFNPSRQGMDATGSAIAHYRDRGVNEGIPVGNNVIFLTSSAPSKQRKAYRQKVRIELPVMETVSNSTVSGIAPAPTIAYTAWAEVDFFLPERSSVQVRKDLRKMLASLLANAQVVSLVEDLDNPI